jgi:SAM-dependent methyltransferase
MPCRICGTPTGRQHRVREKMFGLRDRFTYFECSGCGCCQLVNPPDDLGRYYPSNYYSFAEPRLEARSGRVRRWAERQRSRAQVLGARGLWGLVARLKARADLTCFRHAPLQDRDTRILDVGCGSGLLLRKLQALGFRQLVGIDPFLPGDQQLGPNLLARSLTELAYEAGRAQFDLVMFHHSLEHMPDTVEALALAARLLRPGGVCLVRLPVASSEAWSLYGTNWVELDAPRHFFLHTPHSLGLAARRAGLTLNHMALECDSLPYWGSELYRRGLTLYDPERQAMRSPRSVFSVEEMRAFARRAWAAARRGRGGPAAFYFQRVA